MFKLINADDSARYGRLKTAHGSIETPFFMPVATKATVKHISPEELSKIGIKSIISNAFILYLSPGVDIIKKAGGIHEFMDFDKVIFTDSGGFQILDPGFLQRIVDSGVYFKNPFNGQMSFFSPEKCIQIQNGLGSDVAMCLDDVPRYGRTKSYIKASMKRTAVWAERCLKAHKNQKQMLFAIAHGGIFPDLRKQSTIEISKMDFDGYAIGGLCIGEEKKRMFEMVDISNRLMPEEKPRYLMGVGSPRELVLAIEKGMDIFDSAFPTRNARHATIFTFNGSLKILNRKFREDNSPIDRSCKCYTCRKFSRAYLHYLIKVNEPFGMRLATYHNLYFVERLMEKARKAIKNNEFREFKKEFLGSCVE